MTAPGFNPIRWNCLVTGCFNYHRHYDIEHFAQCFPRGINFTDLDGFVEVNGHCLIAEFKMKGADVTEGQRRAFECLTAMSDKITVLVVRCDYRSGEIFGLKVIRNGKSSDWRDCDLDRFMLYLSQWAERVQRREAA